VFQRVLFRQLPIYPLASKTTSAAPMWLRIVKFLELYLGKALGRQLFFEVMVRKDEMSCLTFVPLHFGHRNFFFSYSEIDMISEKPFLHFSHTNSYVGMSHLPYNVNAEALNGPKIIPTSNPTSVWGSPWYIRLQHCILSLGELLCSSPSSPAG
jgi:hypothetical protein